MPRNITAAQTRARDFDKSDALAQTNQTKYNFFFFFAWHKKHKKIIFSRSKIKQKSRARFFKFYIVL